MQVENCSVLGTPYPGAQGHCCKHIWKLRHSLRIAVDFFPDQVVWSDDKCGSSPWLQPVLWMCNDAQCFLSLTVKGDYCGYPW